MPVDLINFISATNRVEKRIKKDITLLQIINNIDDSNDTEIVFLGDGDAETEIEIESVPILESEAIKKSPQDDNYAIAYERYKTDFIDQNIKAEPILSEENSRYTVYPIQYKKIWDNYKSQQKLNWVVEEIDLSKDPEHWEKILNKKDRTFLLHVLAFFSAFDGIVDENLAKNLISMIKIKEGEMAYGKQFDMENVHGEMYSLMLDTFVRNNSELKNKLINSIKTMKCVKKKADWCRRWIHSDKTFAHKLCAFAIVEGIFFSGSFASIFWLKTRSGSIMPGLRKSNKFISRDENLHVELACIIYKLLLNRIKEEVIFEIIDEAVHLEDEFINSSLPCKLLGMNAASMSQYIRYCADRLLVQLGYNKKYQVINPFEFMEKIDSQHKPNFFEERNDMYFDSKIDNVRQFEILEHF